MKVYWCSGASSLVLGHGARCHFRACRELNRIVGSSLIKRRVRTLNILYLTFPVAKMKKRKLELRIYLPRRPPSTQIPSRSKSLPHRSQRTLLCWGGPVTSSPELLTAGLLHRFRPIYAYYK